jgi:hypothetical protein
MSIKLSTHKHEKITGLYKHSSEELKDKRPIEYWLDDVISEVDFWDKYRDRWEPSYSVKRIDLIELTEEEKANL